MNPPAALGRDHTYEYPTVALAEAAAADPPAVSGVTLLADHRESDRIVDYRVILLIEPDWSSSFALRVLFSTDERVCEAIAGQGRGCQWVGSGTFLPSEWDVLQ